MWFFKKRKARKKAEKKLVEVNLKQAQVKEVQQSVAAMEKKIEVNEITAKEVVKETTVENNEQPKEVIKPKKVVEPKVLPEDEGVEESEVKKNVVIKYHVSQNKKEGTAHLNEWRVRKEGSTKTIKFFKTQVEAIEYAKTLADNQDASIVIHKVDGSIRKQDYSKK